MIVAAYMAATLTQYQGRIPAITLQCMQYLRRAYPTVMISVEVEKPGRTGLEELAAEADVVFYSKSWAVQRGYNDATSCVKAQAYVARRAYVHRPQFGSANTVIQVFPILHMGRGWFSRFRYQRTRAPPPACLSSRITWCGRV